MPGKVYSKFPMILSLNFAFLANLIKIGASKSRYSFELKVPVHPRTTGLLLRKLFEGTNILVLIDDEM